MRDGRQPITVDQPVGKAVDMRQALLDQLGAAVMLGLSLLAIKPTPEKPPEPETPVEEKIVEPEPTPMNAASSGLSPLFAIS